MKDIERGTGIDASKFFPESIKNNIEDAASALEKYKKAIE
jgi:hypothetical protein